MGFPEMAFNLFPGMGGYSLVARRSGMRLAEELIGSGESHTAEWFHGKGLVDVLFEPGEACAEPAGLIRINTSRPAARLLLEPSMDRFLAAYPKLRLELVMDDGFSNIVAEGLDAGIRLGESLDEHMVAVPVTPMLEMAIVGAPAYFQRHGIPETPADLMQHNCLSYRYTSSGTIDRWSFSSPDAEGRTVVLEPQGNAVFNDDDSMLRAAAQGIGLVQHIDLCVRRQLADGTLMRVLRPWCKPFPGFFLYVPSRAQMPAKIRALMDFLVEQRLQLDQEKRDILG